MRAQPWAAANAPTTTACRSTPDDVREDDGVHRGRRGTVRHAHRPHPGCEDEQEAGCRAEDVVEHGGGGEIGDAVGTEAECSRLPRR
ncbi:hypothetical protein OPAG_00809 [Rhodococcus opacus PD630]|nr:hypothetical protein Pd630_LPD06432 [Rhodococcus opacus PD630]EHI40449.1 hypothetical protein OPAG_00809 [Rhodococcus opacus PD630]